MCYDVDPMLLTGTCFAVCDGSMQVPLCGPGSTCFSDAGGAVNLCVPTCDPLAPETCTGVCVFDPMRLQAICLVDASGPTKIDDPCKFINGCPAGSACVLSAGSTVCSPQSELCCQALCDVTAPEVCTAQAGHECLPFFMGEPPPEHANVGLCVVPPKDP